jgi:hypothetical protein
MSNIITTARAIEMPGRLIVVSRKVHFWYLSGCSQVERQRFDLHIENFPRVHDVVRVEGLFNILHYVN